jgi:hypothetical protein
MSNPGANSFNAFPGLYGLIFLNLEPLSTLIPALTTVFVPGGAAWFYNEQVPGGTFQSPDGPHIKMVLGQLVNGKYRFQALLTKLNFECTCYP